MKIYKSLFYLLFKLLKSFEAGFTHQTDSNRSFEVVMIMSLFELLNLMSFFPMWKGKILFVPYIGFFLINLMIFQISKRYKNIVDDFGTFPPSSSLNVIAASYLVLTIIGFVVTR
jgi:hypothetical protein